MNIFYLSWKNLWHKPLSTLLSIILFALGVGLITFLLLTSEQVEEKFEKNLANVDLVLGAKGSPLQLILCGMYHIDAPTGNIKLKDARPFLNPKHPLIAQAIPLSLGDAYKGYRIVGTLPTFLSLYDAQLKEGALWHGGDMEVCIGINVADALGLKIGDTFKSSHGLVNDDDGAHTHDNKYKVVGILQATGAVIDQLILTNTESIWEVHEHENHKEVAHTAPIGTEKRGLDNLLDTLNNEQDITSILLTYKNKTNYQSLNMPRNINQSTNLQAANPAYEMNRLYAMMGVGEDALDILAAIILFVSGLSIFISLYNSLKERKYELALLRVMGASRQRLFLMILIEGLLLAFIGYCIGLIISHLGMEVLAKAMQGAYKYSFTGKIFLKEEYYIFIGALIIGILAAAIPAFQAFKTNISKTLAKT